MFYKKKPISERFWAKVNKTDSCWLWTGGKTGHGYGSISAGSKNDGSFLAHRISLILNGISIPEKMFVDHKCKNPACVNPDHLRVVTPKINSLENSNSLPAKSAKKTHCLRGHELINDNIYRSPSLIDQRRCRICSNYRQNLNRAKKKQKLMSVTI